MKLYESLFKIHRNQPVESIFAHFYPVKADRLAPPTPDDFDEPFRAIARQTIDGAAAWGFQQPRFRDKHAYSHVPKLRNYLNYTFRRLLELETASPGNFFATTTDGQWTAFNTGLQNHHGADLLAVFQKYQPRPDEQYPRPASDWVYKGCSAPNDAKYRSHFGTFVPDIAVYSADGRDFVFDVTYRLERDVFDHLFERAKERAGLPNLPDEVVRNYLRGAIENLIPKIRRNYKVAIPVYYVEERRMQLLLPFYSASGNVDEVSCFLVERDDSLKSYRLKTIFDLDQAYFSARLITRPDRDWLNP